ncbi:hypothetical protein, partial [Aeromonas hydrophila]|uniref:hypothetical protein n=1 Tax=Aeromonas hydrophila TaxID=644 RepID=UPI002B46E91F
EPAGMTTIGLSYSLVKISTKCAPALLILVVEVVKNLITNTQYNGKEQDNGNSGKLLVTMELYFYLWLTFF